MNSINDFSISMLIDNDIQNNKPQDDICGYKPLPLKSSLNINDRKLLIKKRFNEMKRLRIPE